MKILRHRLLIIVFLCVALFVVLLTPHVVNGLRSWSLEYAVEQGNIQSVIFLLNHGANPDMPSDSFTPLMQSLQRRHDNISYVLINKGANINAVGSFGITPLLCADLSDTSLISYLVQHGANTNAQNNAGTTALMSAAFDLHDDTVQLLLDNGAKPNIQDKDGQTALMQVIALENPSSKLKQEAIITLLLKAGTNVHLKNFQGQDVIALSKQTGNISIINIIQKYDVRN